MATQPTQQLITVAQYYQMADGVLHEDDRVELIEGELHWMTPIGSPHAACINALVELFSEQLARRAVIGPQNPIHLDAHSEPQPDLYLAQPPRSRYRSGHPIPADLLLVVEVADTTLRYDRQKKAPLYAEHDIPEYWIVNLPQETVEVYTQPQGGHYRQRTVRRRGQQVTPAAFQDIIIPVDDIFD